jgi:hypothetical protein
MHKLTAYYDGKSITKFFSCVLDAGEWREDMDALYAKVVWVKIY